MADAGGQVEFVPVLDPARPGGEVLPITRPLTSERVLSYLPARVVNLLPRASYVIEPKCVNSSGWRGSQVSRKMLFRPLPGVDRTDLLATLQRLQVWRRQCAQGLPRRWSAWSTASRRASPRGGPARPLGGWCLSRNRRFGKSLTRHYARRVRDFGVFGTGHPARLRL